MLDTDLSIVFGVRQAYAPRFVAARDCFEPLVRSPGVSMSNQILPHSRDTAETEQLKWRTVPFVSIRLEVLICARESPGREIAGQVFPQIQKEVLVYGSCDR